MVDYRVVNETVQYFQFALEEVGLHSDAKRLWGEVKCATSARAVLDTVAQIRVPTHIMGQKNAATFALRSVV